MRAERVREYLIEVGSPVPAGEKESVALEAFRGDLAALAAPQEVSPATEIQALLSYRVPRLAPDGSCSLRGELDETPFDLRPYLGFLADGLAANELSAADAGADLALLGRHSQILRLQHLREVAKLLERASGADWTGIYRRVGPSGEVVLVKEAYRGRPSRAIFPCTAEFARASNNVTAVLGKRVVLVEDVGAHRAAGNPYYECDPEVQSELCMPILRAGEAVGLIDLESFRPRHFTAERLVMTALAAIYLAARDLV